MNYDKIYKSLVDRAKNANRSKSIRTYYEAHHILPEFMFFNRTRNKNRGHLPGNPNCADNIVLLTPREHFICHVLLYKIYLKTRYEYQCGAALLLFYTHFGSKHTRFTKGGFHTQSKKYERYRLLGIQSISNARKGKFPAKDAITGEAVGSIDRDHPKVLSGEWVHHTKGRKASSEEIANRPSQCGSLNSNFKELTDERKHRLFRLVKDTCVVENHVVASLVVARLKIEFKKDFSKISGAWIRNNFGGFGVLTSEVNQMYGTTFSYNPYFRSTSQKDLASTNSSKFCWVNDGNENKRVLKTELCAFLELNKTFKKGKKPNASQNRTRDSKGRFTNKSTSL